MALWFHGTNKKASEIIIKDGFKNGTFFAKNLSDSLTMGGEYVFWVWFDKDPTEYWEYVSNKEISKDQILLLRKYSISRLYQNETLLKKIRHYHSTLMHGENILLCKTCEGKGEMNNREFDECANGKYGKTCSKCGGFGCLTKEGMQLMM